MSLICGDLEDHVTDIFDVVSGEFRTKDQGSQTEGQYIYRRERFNLTAGFGFSNIDRDLYFSLDFDGITLFDASNDQQITETSGYVYGNLDFPDPVTWTAGLSYDYFNALKVDKLTPAVRSAVFGLVKPGGDQ